MLAESSSLELHERDAALYIKGSPAQETFLPLTLVSGCGETVFDADGREYLDFAAGLLVPCGHVFEPVVSAVRQACGELEACEDYTNPYRATLGELMERVFPGALGGVQYYSSGTEAVEAGLRLIRAISGKDGFVGFHGSYHGKTLGAAAVAGMKFWNDARPDGFLRAPYCCVGPDEGAAADAHVTRSLDELRMHFDASASRIAGVVIEAIQGGAGVRIPPRAFLDGVQELCREFDVLLMVDEVFTGMGRTGSFFAYQRFDLDPDLVAVGKGLGNGFPITAILVHERHAGAIQGVEGGTTYGGNPVSCAAAVRTLTSVIEDGLVAKAATAEEVFEQGLGPLRDVGGIADVRIAGCLASVEFAEDSTVSGKADARVKATYEACCQEGLLTTPRGRTLRLSPPLMVSDAAQRRAIEIVNEAAMDVCQSA